MKIKNIACLLSFLLVGMTACNKKVEITEFTTIKGEKVEKAALESLAEEVDIIPLETTPACRIRQVSDLLTDDGIYFIKDAHQRVLAFDETGKFLGKMGDCANVSRMFLNKEAKTLNLICNNERELLELTYQGEQVRREPLRRELRRASKIVLTSAGDTVVAYNSPMILELGGHEYKVFGKTKSADLCQHELTSISLMSANSVRPLSVYGDRALMATIFSDTIYRWKEGQFVPLVRYEGEQPFVNGYEIKKKYRGARQEEIRKALAASGKNLELTNLIETDRFLIVCANPYLVTIWDKADEEGVSFTFVQSEDMQISSGLATAQYVGGNTIMVLGRPEKESNNPTIQLYHLDTDLVDNLKE